MQQGASARNLPLCQTCPIWVQARCIELDSLPPNRWHVTTTFLSPYRQKTTASSWHNKKEQEIRGATLRWNMRRTNMRWLAWIIDVSQVEWCIIYAGFAEVSSPFKEHARSNITLGGQPNTHVSRAPSASSHWTCENMSFPAHSSTFGVSNVRSSCSIMFLYNFDQVILSYHPKPGHVEAIISYHFLHFNSPVQTWGCAKWQRRHWQSTGMIRFVR